MERNQLALLRERFIREAEEFIETGLRRQCRQDEEASSSRGRSDEETTAEEIEANSLPQFT